LTISSRSVGSLVITVIGVGVELRELPPVESTSTQAHIIYIDCVKGIERVFFGPATAFRIVWVEWPDHVVVTHVLCWLVHLLELPQLSFGLVNKADQRIVSILVAVGVFPAEPRPFWATDLRADPVFRSDVEHLLGLSSVRRLVELELGMTTKVAL
jgi:hypothetical protein